MFIYYFYLDASSILSTALIDFSAISSGTIILGSSLIKQSLTFPMFGVSLFYK
jgi:hypothetical protein